MSGGSRFGTPGFEDCSHEELVALIAGGDPEALVARGDELCRMSQQLGEVGDRISARVDELEWEGRSAEMVRAWGEHFRRESSALEHYALVAGKAMKMAGEALAEAKSSMPPPPAEGEGTGGSLFSRGVERGVDEFVRQEAIRVLERLSSHYQVATEHMASALEPRFQPIQIDLQRVFLPDGVGPASPAGAAGAVAFREATESGGGAVPAVGVPGPTAGGAGRVPVSEPEWDVSGPVAAPVAGPGHALVDERVGLSLDSLRPPAVTNPVPVQPIGDGPVPAGGGGGKLPPPVPPPQVGPWRVPGLSGPGVDGPGRRVVPGLEGPGRLPGEQTAVRPGVGLGGGSQPVPGRPPHGPVPGHSGITGGTPRPAPPLPRPGSAGVVAPGIASAVRDPVTGAIRGPGGGLVGTPPASAAGPRPLTGPVTGREAQRPEQRQQPDQRRQSPPPGVTGQPVTPRPPRRNRRDRDQQERDR